MTNHVTHTHRGICSAAMASDPDDFVDEEIDLSDRADEMIKERSGGKDVLSPLRRIFSKSGSTFLVRGSRRASLG